MGSLGRGLCLLLPVVLLLETGCTTGQGPGEAVSLRDSAGVSIVTINADPATLPLWTLDSVPLVVVEGGVNGVADFEVLGPVRWLGDGRILVVDAGANVVHLFASSGALVRSIGRRGDGPGEFRDIIGAAVTSGDSILLFDRRHRRGTWLDRNLEVVTTVPVPGPVTLGTAPLNLLPAGDGAFVAHRSRFEDSLLEPGREIQRSRMREDLLLFQRDGTPRDSTPGFEGRHSIRTAEADYRAPWSPRPFVAADSARVVYGSGAPWRGIVLDFEFRVVMDLRWPVMDQPMTTTEVEAFRARARHTFPARMTAAQVDHVLDIQFSPAILPTGRPAIGRVILDPGGPIWVGRFEPFMWPLPWEPVEWVILTPGGVPTGRVHLPPGIRVEEVRGDTLLVVQKDSLDVERVAVYRLQRDSH